MEKPKYLEDVSGYKYEYYCLNCLVEFATRNDLGESVDCPACGQSGERA